LGYAEIFNEAFDLYKRNFVLFAGIGAVVYLPYALLSALAANAPLLKGLLALGLYLPSMAVNGAIVKALADRYLGRDATIGGSWRYLLRRLMPYLATSIRVGLMVGLGLLFFVIPGIFVAFNVFFVPAVMMVEDRYYREAMRRSGLLAAGQWGRIFVVGVLTLVLFAIVLVVVGVVEYGLWSLLMPGSTPTEGAHVPLWAALVQEILDAGAQIVLTPITSLLALLLYFDVRVRKEGFDVELLAQEMDEISPGVGPTASPA
jgi:hypothetical protein